MATGAYAWRRFLRIVPAYWAALALSAWWLGRSDVFTGDGLWTYFGFAQTWRVATIGGGLTQAWTLCIEIVFYAFLPVWALLMRRTGRSLRAEAIGLGALFAISVAWKVVVLATGPAGADPRDARSCSRCPPTSTSSRSAWAWPCCRCGCATCPSRAGRAWPTGRGRWRRSRSSS